MARMIYLALSSALLLTCASMTAAEVPPPNYDESKVSSYQLPDPLTLANGEKVTNAKSWQKKRRAEVLELFRSNVYGRSPGKPRGLKFQVEESSAKALDGKATRKQVSVFFTGKPDGPK